LTQTRTAIKATRPIRQKTPSVPEVLPLWATVDELAVALNLSPKFVRAELKAGRAPFVMSGSKYLIDTRGFDELHRAEAGKNAEALRLQASKGVSL
jgi:excisionase family DNA binding protein